MLMLSLSQWLNSAGMPTIGGGTPVRGGGTAFRLNLTTAPRLISAAISVGPTMHWLRIEVWLTTDL